MILASREIIDSVNHAFTWITVVSGIFLVGIVVCMLVFIFKYHRSRHPDPAHIPGNFRLEVLWTIIPTIIAIWMFWEGYKGFMVMRSPPPDAYVVEAIGRQWSWTFRYPDEDITHNELVVPVNTPVRVNVYSPPDDVVHSLYIPDFKVKEDCVPGLWNFLWFEADRVGRHHIFCAEFCGKDHSKMLSALDVRTKEDFEAWLDKKLEARYLPVDPAKALDPESEEIQQAGAPVLFATYCASCHGPEGQGGLVEGARDFRVDASWKKSRKIADIFRTLTEGLEGTQMRSFSNLPPWERLALAHHVRNFYTGDKGAAETSPEEMKKLVEEYKLDEPPNITRRFPIREAMKKIVEEARN
jgi:cytochrome c oxidase subunit 2